jgi:hypothetical protein
MSNNGNIRSVIGKRKLVSSREMNVYCFHDHSEYGRKAKTEIH